MKLIPTTALGWLRQRYRALELDGRDLAILLGLVMVWIGLRGIYQPLAPLCVGGFLLWYTTIRRVPE